MFLSMIMLNDNQFFLVQIENFIRSWVIHHPQRVSLALNRMLNDITCALNAVEWQGEHPDDADCVVVMETIYSKSLALSCIAHDLWLVLEAICKAWEEGAHLRKYLLSRPGLNETVKEEKKEEVKETAKDEEKSNMEDEVEVSFVSHKAHPIVVDVEREELSDNGDEEDEEEKDEIVVDEELNNNSTASPPPPPPPGLRRPASPPQLRPWNKRKVIVWFLGHDGPHHQM